MQDWRADEAIVAGSGAATALRGVRRRRTCRPIARPGKCIFDSASTARVGFTQQVGDQSTRRPSGTVHTGHAGAARQQIKSAEPEGNGKAAPLPIECQQEPAHQRSVRATLLPRQQTRRSVQLPRSPRSLLGWQARSGSRAAVAVPQPSLTGCLES